MAKPRSGGDEGAPAWMLTLGDITMLLLTFFVLLVSFMSMSKSEPQPNMEISVQTPEGPGGGPHLLTAEAQNQMETDVIARLSQADATGEGQGPLNTVDLGPYGRVEMQVQNDSRNFVFRIGGVYGGFDEGEYHLRSGLFRFLDLIKAWRAGKETRIVVRGFTDTVPYDSLVPMEDGAAVPFNEYYAQVGPEAAMEDWPEKADFMLLAYRRAQEVARYLSEAVVETDPHVPAERIRMEVLGPFEPAIYARNPEGRQPANRRVEIIVTSNAGR